MCGRGTPRRRPLESLERGLERLGGVDVEVVGGLVEQQEVVALGLEAEDLQARLLTARQGLVGAVGGVGEAVTGERAHGELHRLEPLDDDLEHPATGEVGAFV
jgi:hypothetical protein